MADRPVEAASTSTQVGRPSGARAWVVTLVGVATFVLVTFAVATALGTDEQIEDFLSADRAGWLIALACLVLLTSDAALPIPSTLTMALCGAAVGTLGGTVIGTVGGTASSLLCYLGGRRLGLLGDGRTGYGWAVAVAATRWVPVAAEVIAVGAGRSTLLRTPFLLAATMGQLPVAFACSLAGSHLTS